MAMADDNPSAVITLTRGWLKSWYEGEPKAEDESEGRLRNGPHVAGRWVRRHMLEGSPEPVGSGRVEKVCLYEECTVSRG